MAENGSEFTAQIIDFNPRRMTPEEIAAHGIPQEYSGLIGDWRQYLLNIGRHVPEGVSWLHTDQPSYFLDVMSNEESVNQLKRSDSLILSGSGLSAHGFQEGKIAPEYKAALEKTQEVIRDHLGEGKWILGICFGGQLATHAVGGSIGRLPDNVTEAGWLRHLTTTEARQDPVFGALGNEFWAPHLHNDYVATLPEKGWSIQTASGTIKISKASTLAVRLGYLDKNGLKNPNTMYTMASMIEFDNGAKLYQIQPHPEMATPDKANFLVRMNPWIAKEMGQAYYDEAQKVPPDADFSVAQVIPRFVDEAQRHLEEKGVTFVKATLVQNIFQYLLE